MDLQRLYVQAALAAGVLAGGTFLAHEHVITSDAVVALYGSALGAIGAGTGVAAAAAVTKAANGVRRSGRSGDEGGLIVPSVEEIVDGPEGKA